MFIDTDGIPDDIVGAIVMLALALGNADEVMLDEVVGGPDELETDDAAEELLVADMVGSPDGAELVGNPLDELFNEIAGKPEEAEEV